MARLITIGCAGDIGIAGRCEPHTLHPTVPARETSVVPTGERFSARITGLTSGQRAGFVQRAANAMVDTDTYYLRFRIRVATLPSGDNVIFGFANGTTALSDLRIRLKSTGYLELMDSTTVLDTSSAALSLNTWYRIELAVKRNTGAGDSELEWRIDGAVEYGPATTLSLFSGTTNYREVQFGGNLTLEAQTAGDWYIASVVLNDSTGSYHTSWVGDSRLTYAFVESGSTPTYDEPTATGAASNVAVFQVDPPGDATAVYAACVANSSSFAVANSRFLAPCQSASAVGIGASDTIHGLAIGMMWASASAGTSALCAGVKSGSAADMGTAKTIATTAPSFIDDTFPTNNYEWQSVDPVDAAAWTATKIDALEIGFRASDTTPNARVVGLWAIIEYTPAAGSASLPPFRHTPLRTFRRSA